MSKQPDYTRSRFEPDTIEQLSKQLSVACSQNKVDKEAIVRLIAKGARVNWADPDKQNNTALLTFVYGQSMTHNVMNSMIFNTPDAYYENIISTLIEFGADINYQNSVGMSAIHYTAYNYNPVHTAVLLKLGANTEVKNDDNYDPYMLAIENGPHSLECLYQLLSYRTPKDKNTIQFLDEKMKAFVPADGIPFKAPDYYVECQKIIAAAIEKLDFEQSVPVQNNNISETEKLIQIKNVHKI